MDKTGTLTANRMLLNGIDPLGDLSGDEIARAKISATLGTFARSASATNATSEAILAGTDGQRVEPTDEVPFSSARKWSAPCVCR